MLCCGNGVAERLQDLFVDLRMEFRLGLPRWRSRKAFCCVDDDDGINHADVHLVIVYAIEVLVFDENSTIS